MEHGLGNMPHWCAIDSFFYLTLSACLGALAGLAVVGPDALRGVAVVGLAVGVAVLTWLVTWLVNGTYSGDAA